MRCNVCGSIVTTKQSDPTPIESYSIATDTLAARATDLLKIWSSGLTHSGQPDAKLSWYYRDNTAGEPTLFFLFGSNSEPNHARPCGVAAVGTRNAHFNARQFSAGALIDFVIEPAHRTLFPALLLQRTVREQSHSKHAVLYGLPNPKSLAVVRRAGYHLAGQMTRYARVLRTASYLSRTMPRGIAQWLGPTIDFIRMTATKIASIRDRQFRVAWLDEPDAHFEALWEAVSGSAPMKDTFIGQRDRAFLHWRFVRNPMRSYKFFTVATNDDALIAYAVCEEQDGVLNVRDFLVDERVGNAIDMLFRQLFIAAYDRGNTTISVEFLGSENITKQLKSAGLQKREARPFFVSVDAAADPGLAILANADAWYLTNADEDW